ncbi:MAG: polysaccharide deacetylase [Arcobacter sp.]|nr:polysaccharide deacetylase [Arcobacter sp.]
MEWLFLILVLIFIYYSYKYAWWTKSVSFSYPRVLMYHMISEHKKGTKFNGLRVSPLEFEKQIKFLNDDNWTFFTMNELILNKDNLPEKSIAITFDDGYEDNYTNALPILKKYNAKATIYLVVDRHDREWSSKRKKKNSSGELKRESKLSNNQVKELIESGLIEIGSHTMTHDNLSSLSKIEKEHEIFNSKKEIEKEFNIKCNSFCYPFGIYDKEDVSIVRKVAYTNATTTEKGIDDLKNKTLFELKRVTISGKDNIFAFKIKIKRGLRGVNK